MLLLIRIDKTMSQFDLNTLPAPLPRYFAAADHSDTAILFAPDATVRDEGETLSGRAAITDWLARVEARYHPRYVVQDAATNGDHIEVTFVVSGTFPGSPATLRQAFLLGDGLIRSLRTL